MLFFGYINTTQLFDRVDFGNTSLSRFDGFGFDQMTIGSQQQVSQAPEPSQWLVMGIAAGSLLLRRRRTGSRRNGSGNAAPAS